ncbi:unnamed protein product [Cercospora beticola]|nr:unnamed protein product [Cercospora beticola]
MEAARNVALPPAASPIANLRGPRSSHLFLRWCKRCAAAKTSQDKVRPLPQSSIEHFMSPLRTSTRQPVGRKTRFRGLQILQAAPPCVQSSTAFVFIELLTQPIRRSFSLIAVLMPEATQLSRLQHPCSRREGNHFLQLSLVREGFVSHDWDGHVISSSQSLRLSHEATDQVSQSRTQPSFRQGSCSSKGRPRKRPAAANYQVNSHVHVAFARGRQSRV